MRFQRLGTDYYQMNPGFVISEHLPWQYDLNMQAILDKIKTAHSPDNNHNEDFIWAFRF